MKLKHTVTLLIAINSYQLIFADQLILNNLEPSSLITVTARSQTKEQNEAHKKFCEERGSVDVTNKANIQKTSGAKDVIMCIHSNDSELGIKNLLDQNTGVGVWLQAVAPNGNVGRGVYGITGMAYYKGANAGSILELAVGVPQDNCSVIGSCAVQGSDGFGSLYVSCSYPSGINPTQSYTRAVLQGSSDTAYGTIYHN